MELILARHGNTFGKGDSVVWVGSRNDLPLVETGKEQAVRLGDFLKHSDLQPTTVVTGPLLRMTSYANIILERLGSDVKPSIDARLNEIDYGDWSGLTTDEVCEKFGKDQYEQWEKHSQWPTQGGWGESEADVINRIQLFAQDVAQKSNNHDRVLVVASNGCLRYFLTLVSADKNIHTLENVKMATGSLSKLTLIEGKWQLDFWNKKP